jgi:hypothetical protein
MPLLKMTMPMPGFEEIGTLRAIKDTASQQADASIKERD